jgi:hypothetical protein
LLAYFPYFENNKSRLMRLPCCLCLWISAWTNLCESRYVHHGESEPTSTA